MPRDWDDWDDSTEHFRMEVHSRNDLRDTGLFAPCERRILEAPRPVGFRADQRRRYVIEREKRDG